MHLQIIRTPLIVAAVILAGACAPSPVEPADGGGGDGAVAVTYTKAVQPILKARCAPCHTGQGMGEHNIATNYADVKKPNQSNDFDVCWKDTEMTMPKTVGECSLLLINNGRMPQGAGCAAMPPLMPDACLTAAEKATITTWVAAGMPE